MRAKDNKWSLACHVVFAQDYGAAWSCLELHSNFRSVFILPADFFVERFGILGSEFGSLIIHIPLGKKIVQLMGTSCPPNRGTQAMASSDTSWSSERQAGSILARQ